jgi:hypothetical protein
VAEAGDFVYTPPNSVHSFLIESETARLVGFNHPSPRFAELQTRAAPLFGQPGGPDMEGIVKVAGEVGVELLGPPMEPRS